MGSSIKRIQYRYDSVGNRIGMTDPDGGRFTYAYDGVNRISHLVNPQGDRTSYAYDPAGRRTVKKLANGTRASFSYDSASNLTRLANLKSDGTTISSFDYDYDRVGNRTAVLEGGGSRVTWSYDATYQLTGEHRTGASPYRDTYTYDPAGNRLAKLHDGARTSYSYDAANQLEWSEDATGRTTYAFDADGNQELVQEPGGDRTTTSWDYENRTTLVQLSSGVRNTMAYEPGGLRVTLEESVGTKKFVWDEQNYLAETDENDDTQMVYTNEPRLYGNLASQRRGSNSHWYQFDAIGSARELTDVSEIVTDTRLYDAWGVPVASSGSTVFPFTYVGRLGYWHDKELGAQYVRARFYGPPIGRWHSVDPDTTAQRDPNAYRYVRGRPTHMVDPSGLGPEDELLTCLLTVLGGSMNPGIWAGAVCVAPFFAYLKWKQTRGVWNNDAWAHCVVSCMAARSCTTLIAALGGVAKEFVDCVEVKLGWHGEWSDYMANAAGLACAGPAAVILPPGVGTLICLLQESCEDCCDRKYSRNV